MGNFDIWYNGKYTSIFSLFEGAEEGYNTNLTRYYNVDGKYYKYNKKGFYYLKRNINFHNLKIHQDCPDLDNHFAINKKDLPQPVLKGCYPLSGTRNEIEISPEYNNITIQNGTLTLKNTYANITKTVKLPRVVGVEITGGGGAGGNTGLGDILRNYYFAGGGGAGGTLIAYLDTYNNGTTFTFTVGMGGPPSAAKTGTGYSGGDSTIIFGTDTVLATAKGGKGGGGSSDGIKGQGGQGGDCEYTNTEYFYVIHHSKGGNGWEGIDGISLKPVVINELKVVNNVLDELVQEAPGHSFIISNTINNGYERVQGTSSCTDYVCKGSGGASAWSWGQTIIVSNDTANVSLAGPFWTNSQGITSHKDTVAFPYGAGGAGARISGWHVGDDWNQGHLGYRGRIRFFW